MGRFSYLLPKFNEATVKELVAKEQEYIIELNQSQMYDKGVLDVTQPQRKERYADSTKAQKKKRATYKKVDFITLKWAGEFYRQMKVLLFNDKFILSSDNLIWAKYLEPQERFENALGLTEENKDKLRKKLKKRWLRDHK